MTKIVSNRLTRLLAITLPCLIVTGLLMAQDTPSIPAKKATPEEMKAIAGQSTFKGLVVGITATSVTVLVPDERQYKAAMAKVYRLQGPAKEEAMKQVNMIPRGKEYEIEFSEKCTLRKANRSTSLEFDDKGQPKVYTPKELEKMKGTGPGWNAGPEDFAPLSPVTVNMTRSKTDKDKPIATMVFVNNVAKKQ
jgi:hypothetical protein